MACGRLKAAETPRKMFGQSPPRTKGEREDERFLEGSVRIWQEISLSACLFETEVVTLTMRSFVRMQFSSGEGGVYISNGHATSGESGSHFSIPSPTKRNLPSGACAVRGFEWEQSNRAEQ